MIGLTWNTCMTSGDMINEFPSLVICPYGILGIRSLDEYSVGPPITLNRWLIS